LHRVSIGGQGPCPGRFLTLHRPDVTRPRIPRALLLLAIPAALLLLPTITVLITDYWWFQEIGYEVVFTRTLLTKTLLFLGVGGLAALVLGTNLWFAQRGAVPEPVVVRLGEVTQPVDLSGTLRRFTRPVVVGLALVTGLGAIGLSDTVLQFLARTPFGHADPIFGRDVGWYVFSLPMVSAAVGVLRSLVTLSLIVLVPVYFLRGDVVLLPRGLRIEPTAGRHLGALLSLWFLGGAAALWVIEPANLLYSETGPMVGASYTDLTVTLPALRLGAVVAVLAAALALLGAARAQLGWFAFLGIAAHGVVAILGRGIAPALVQKYVVEPTELTRETPYLAHHLEATRRAWGLDSVEVRDLPGEARLTLADIRANGPTIENVRLWDRAPLLRTFKQLQEIRTYYDFVSVDDDRYWIDGKYRQVLLSPRELNPASLPTRTFINEHLTFTHGMGLTLSPVNEVTPEGLPILFVQDLPPRTTGELQVTRPQIYFGELTDSHVFVNTNQREFDYPSGEANVFRAYTGRGGVPVGGLLRRSLFSIFFGSSKVLLSGDITSESRVLYHRNIVTRVRKALPFLTFDRDPYLVIAKDGTLHWIQDAFTSTTRYPYAFRAADGTSYMRNSVKIVIDAYHGSLTAYVADPGDPLVQTWARVFPGLLQPLDAMADDLRPHLRYPDDLFRRQNALYTTYHLDTPEEFYSREDQWQIPVVDRGDGSVPFMRHIIMRLPEESQAEFIYMAPFTPRGKDNLAAWMVARNDGEHLGKLRVYQFPRQSLVYGPRQIENRIAQNPEISRQLSLWDQRGSQVIKGDLLVIPIESALLYVQPIYLQAEGGRIPELKRVVVAFGDQVVMEETLDGALTALFGSDGERVTPIPLGLTRDSTEAATASGPDVAAMISEARRRYQAAVEAQRAGDWGRYGEELRQLGALLERLEAARAGRP
jgi:uncharacterized membrane protein (UPF0182 family)